MAFLRSQPAEQAAICNADCSVKQPYRPLTLAVSPGGWRIPDYGVPRNYIPSNPYGSVYLLQENSTGKSNYNALQTSFLMNGWHGITSVVNFVWSRSMDNSSDGEDFEPNAAQPNDSNNPQLEYGPSNFNIPRRLTWNFSYQFPKMGGDWQRLKNGWGIDSIVSLQDGQPFQLNYNFEDDYSGGGNGFDRPDVVGPIRYDAKNPLNYLDLTPFAIPCQITAAAQAAPSGTAGDCVPGALATTVTKAETLSMAPPLRSGTLPFIKTRRSRKGSTCSSASISSISSITPTSPTHFCLPISQTLALRVSLSTAPVAKSVPDPIASPPLATLASAIRTSAAEARAAFSSPSNSLSNRMEFLPRLLPQTCGRSVFFANRSSSHVPRKLVQTESTATPALVERRASSPVQL